MSSARDDAFALDRALWTAAMQGRLDDFQRMMAADYQGLYARGFVTAEDDASVTATMTIRGFDFENERVRQIGPGASLVTYITDSTPAPPAETSLGATPLQVCGSATTRTGNSCTTRKVRWARMRLLFALVVASLIAISSPVAAAPVAIEMTEFAVPSSDAGISLYVRNKHPRGMARFQAENVVLFVHGGTYPAEPTFDLPLGGMSWMDYIAQHGYDVWLVDVRGYGKSDHPAEMDQPPGANPPLVRATTAVKDVGSALDYIRAKRGVPKLNLIGWSWGTTIMAMYTVDHSDRVHKLVLYAPQWLPPAGAAQPPVRSGSVPAYRSDSMASAKDRWLAGAPPNKAAGLIPPGWYEQWAAATSASDPVGSRMNPPVLRAPNGVVVDNADWVSGKPLYDPSRIVVPTLVIHAEWDYDRAAYFKLLTNVPYKRYVQIGEGTHYVLMEKNRIQLFSEVQLFLDEQ